MTTVLCNENGPYTVYVSDEHGFNNPKGIWASERLQIAAVGDSFTQGYCVPSGEDMVSLIRRKWPLTLNLGMSSNGPLLMLATIREYLPAEQPPVVLWMYYEGNDLLDFENEWATPILRDYLHTSFKQGLRDKQGEVDTILKSKIDSLMVSQAASHFEADLRRKRTQTDEIRDFTTLRGLRTLLQLTANSTRAPSTSCNIPIFEEALASAKQTVGSWGGTLYFVYLPSWNRYYGAMNECEALRDQVIGSVTHLGIPLVDMHPAFQASKEPAALFALQELTASHYSARGYSLVAHTVVHALESGGRLR
jgi:hypothetical protein